MIEDNIHICPKANKLDVCAGCGHKKPHKKFFECELNYNNGCPDCITLKELRKQKLNKIM